MAPPFCVQLQPKLNKNNPLTGPHWCRLHRYSGAAQFNVSASLFASTKIERTVAALKHQRARVRSGHYGLPKQRPAGKTMMASREGDGTRFGNWMWVLHAQPMSPDEPSRHTKRQPHTAWEFIFRAVLMSSALKCSRRCKFVALMCFLLQHSGVKFLKQYYTNIGCKIWGLKIITKRCSDKK